MRTHFSNGGLRQWVAEKWVDIGAPKKDGKYQPCGRSKGSKRKYPKCVPLAKDLQRLKKEKALKESAIAQLRKRSRDSLARPRAEKNILSTNPEMQKI